jgi:type IV secretion system protein VirB2
MKNRFLRAVALMFVYFGFSGLAFAGGGGGGGLPWESPLQTLANSLTGPVALGISIIAMAAAGGTLVFGGELSEFTRKALLLVLAIAFLVGGAGFMSALFGVTGALV